MTKSDLHPQKNLNNVEDFKGYVNYLCENKNVLWIQLLVSGVSIDTNRVHKYCENMRIQYKLGVWDIELINKNSVFKPFHDLLKQIQFPFHDYFNFSYNVITF